MNEMIEFGGQTYIEVTSPLVETAIKYGDTFAVLNQHGDAAGIGRGELGLYHRGTRHLSGWELLVNDTRPLLLSSNVSPDGALLHVDLTNDDLVEDGVRVAKDTLHIRRKILLREGTWYERLQLTNFGQEELVFRLSFSLGADFADIFEVRGVEHPDKPRPEPPRQAADAVVLGYLGADGVKRTTRIIWGDCDPVWRGSAWTYPCGWGPSRKSTCRSRSPASRANRAPGPPPSKRPARRRTRRSWSRRQAMRRSSPRTNSSTNGSTGVVPTCTCW
ncbi:MAG: glycogen debranching N-terminal domain-containing protein [Guyparkeria sp.]|uniref:glycogen debranching N-terminal domain-containing protein n=1 Tax=Guyparkeria sp. TaxID=2035736 RepID=UPI00397B2CF7